MASTRDSFLDEEDDGLPLYGQEPTPRLGMKGETLRGMLLERTKGSIAQHRLEGTSAQAVVEELLQEMESANAIEAMLLSQMAMTFFQAATLMGAANQLEFHSDLSDKLLNRVDKLMNLFLKQSEALWKLQGRGQQQKITVKHVYVGAGGQAIVGDVETATPIPSRSASPLIEDDGGIEVPPTENARPAAVRVRRRR